LLTSLSSDTRHDRASKVCSESLFLGGSVLYKP
jgi:hypothetical protein